MAKHRTRRKKLSVLTVLGELLISAGLIVVGFIAWQPWYTTTVVAGEQQKLSAQVSAEWRQAAAQNEQQPWNGEVPVPDPVAEPEVFAVLHVPAFGATFANQVAQGIGEWDVLNLAERGVGHYPSTQLPGEPGNFAMAAHRSGMFTTPFKEIMNLRVGDPIVVETADGWYTYRFRSLEYVLPTQAEVLAPFPHSDSMTFTDQIITLTTCHPKDLGTVERAISYGVFESYRPHSEGPPEELVELNPSLKEA